MKQKLEENELDNINGGCGSEHVLKSFDVEILYTIPPDKKMSYTADVALSVYEDTLLDDNGNHIGLVAKKWCEERGYELRGWKFR